jgi:RNA recognition motif-containing protein
MTFCIFFCNLPWDVTSETLSAYLEPMFHQELVNAKVLRAADGRSKGSAHVYFASAEAAERALKDLDKTTYNGRELRLFRSTRKEENQEKTVRFAPYQPPAPQPVRHEPPPPVQHSAPVYYSEPEPFYNKVVRRFYDPNVQAQPETEYWKIEYVPNPAIGMLRQPRNLNRQRTRVPVHEPLIHPETGEIPIEF